MQRNPTIASLLSHRSIRTFTDEPVSDEDLACAVRAGQQASTSSNIQAYCAIRIRDHKRRERLVELTGGQKKVALSPVFLVICGDTRRHRLLAERAGIAYSTNLEGFMLALIDAALFAQNMVVALESMGYGTCYIGGLRNSLQDVQELLNVPEGVWPFFGLCIGRPKGVSAQRPRLEPNAILFEERYPEDSQVFSWIEKYDARMSAWYREQGIDTSGWASRIEQHFEERRRTGNAQYYRGQGASFD